MGSNYFGEGNINVNMGSERGTSSSSSSSRKGKKSSEKPKQPQRGLGVAQLEKIRLHGQMPTHFNQEDMRVQAAFSSLPEPSFSYCSSSSSPNSYGFPSTLHVPGVLSPHDPYERTHIRSYSSQPATTSSWMPNTNIFEAQHFVQQNMTRHNMNIHVEDSIHMKSKKHRSRSMGSSSHNSDSSDTQELDLELRLSI